MCIFQDSCVIIFFLGDMYLHIRKKVGGNNSKYLRVKMTIKIKRIENVLINVSLVAR